MYCLHPKDVRTTLLVVSHMLERWRNCFLVNINIVMNYDIFVNCRWVATRWQ